MGKNKIITSAANWMELGIKSSKRSQTQEGKIVASFLSNVKSRMASADEGAYTNRAQKQEGDYKTWANDQDGREGE